MSKKIIQNGGIEQAILEIVKDTQGLSEEDQKRLDFLQSLPQNRVEETEKEKE
jgi:hypothetical protein